jgi:hypothetical protein
MRDMTLLDTGRLAGLLLLSLVLPLMLSLRRLREIALQRSCPRTVWLGQVVLGIAGVVVLASSAAASFAVLFAALSCGGCAVVLHRQLRPPCFSGPN